MDYTILVNKSNCINSKIDESNLVIVDSIYKENMMLERKTYRHWLSLKEAVRRRGYHIEIESAYRSYEYQSKLMEKLINEKGKEHAYNVLALPGHSEHQTGLALDYLVVKDNQFIIEHDIIKTEDCSYTNSIAHNYGFIIRYPKDKEIITGYKYEPWHLRYVGKELATYLYQNNLTLEEYYLRKESNY